MSEHLSMRVAIFNHPYTDFYSSDSRVFPGAVEHLKKIILDHVQPSNILCFSVVSKKAHPQPLPKPLTHLESYLVGAQSLYSFFTRYSQYGRVDNFDHKALQRFDPQCFLITSFAYCYFDGFKAQVDYLKKRYPQVPIICGGVGPSCDPDYYLSESGVDVVVKCPAELILSKLLKHLAQGLPVSGLPGVYARFEQRDATALTVSDSAKLRPFVAYQPKRHRVQLQVTRGCPKSCAYCSIHSNGFGKWTKVPVSEIMSELTAMALPADTHFDFEDDNVTSDRSYFLSLLEAIKCVFPNATFSAENGIDFTTLDRAVIDELHRYGFTGLNLSLTSVSAETLKRQGRSNYLEQFEQIIGALAEKSMPVVVYYICGLPGDNVKNILETLTYLMSKPVLIGISPFYAVPGTRLSRGVSNLAPIFCRGTSFYPAGELTTKEIVTFFMFTRVINFLKSTQNENWIMDHQQSKEYLATEDRSQPSRQAWRRSLAAKRLTGYRQENNDRIDTPYALDAVLESKLFFMISGETPLKTCDGEALDKKLWL